MQIKLYAGKTGQKDFPEIDCREFKDPEEAQNLAQSIVSEKLGEGAAVHRTLWVPKNPYTKEENQLFVYLTNDSILPVGDTNVVKEKPHARKKRQV